MTDDHLARCAGKVADLIVAWCKMRLTLDRPVFHMHELTGYVGRMSNTAPESTARVLRHLRAQGRVDYRCESRAASRYRLRAFGEIILPGIE